MSLPQGWKLTEPAKPLPPGWKPAEPEPTQNYFADKARRLGRGLPELLGQTVAGLGSNVESAVELGQDALFSTAVKRGDLTPEQAAARRQEMDALLEQSAVMQGAEAVQDVGRQITAVGPKHVQAPDPARDQELGSAVISGATSLVPLLAAPGLAIPTYASMMGEQQRAEAEQMGADRSKQAQAQVLASVTGAGSEALLGVPALLRSIGGAKILPQALGAVEHFIDRAVGRAVERQALARPVSQAIKTAGREGTQEGLEQIAQNVIAKDLVGYDPDRDRTEGAGMATLAGGIVGGGLGGITQAGNDQLQGQAHRDFATQLDTNKNVPEALKTLLLQQDQLLRGLRPAQMFPNGTPELPLPDGLERVQTERGTFHFNPEQTNADTIITLSKLGRENELLNLGRYSKADVETQAAAKGEPIGTVTERTPDGTEVRAAVATPSTAAQTAADMEGQKTPGNIVAPESTQQTLLQRLAATEQADTAAAQAAQEKENADRLARQLDADAKKKLFDNRLTAARRLATDPQADFAAINGAVTSLEDYANDNSLGLTLEQKQQALAELAGLRPRLEKLKPAHDAALDRRAAAAKELEQQAQAAKNARVRADNARIDAIESTGRDPDTGQIVELDKVPEAEFDQLDLEREQITLDAYEAELRRRESAAAQTNEAGFNLRDLFIGRSEHLAAAGLAGPLRLPTPATERARGGLGSELTTIMEGTVPWSYFDKTAAGLDSLAQTLRELGFKAETEDAALQLVQAAFNGQDVRPAGRVEFAQAKDTPGQMKLPALLTAERGTQEWAAAYDQAMEEFYQSARDSVATDPKVRKSAEDQAKRAGETLTPAQAAARLRQWQKFALAQGEAGGNSQKIILSLFDSTGVWSQPWRDAGYTVVQIDQKIVDGEGHEMDVLDIDQDWLNENGLDMVHGVLAACPCTEFAGSGARWFKIKDADGRTAKARELVHHTLAIIEYLQPDGFWAIENPVGRIKQETNIPLEQLQFQPHNYGDPYTKRTQIFGMFNADLPQANVVPTGGSFAWNLRGDASEAKAARSKTFEGFAYAFFMANEARNASADAEAEADQATNYAQTGNRAAWPANFPSVQVQTTLPYLKAHPDYMAAKAGNTAAATKVAAVLVKPAKAAALAAAHPNAILVPVNAQEASGRNKLPLALAQRIKKLTGLPVNRSVVQSNIVAHTGENMPRRLAYPATFTGQIEAGREYILIDDVITSGGSLAALRDYIESQGGHVVNMATFAAAKFSNVIALQPKTALALRQLYGQKQFNEFLAQHGIHGGNAAALTEAEGRWFLAAKSLDAAGDRLAAARNGDSLPGNGTLGRSGRADFASELNPPAPAAPAAPAALSDEQVQRQMSRLRNVLGPIAQDYNLQVGQVADLLEQAGHPREAAALRAGRFGQIEAAITTDLRAQINGLQAQRKLIVIAAQAAKQGKLTGLALHEIAHEFWRMLPAETQAALRRLHAQETGTKTGPLYQGGRLQTNIAVEAGQISPERLAANPDLPVLEWFAERVRALNTQWLDGKMAYAEDSTLRRVWRQLLDMLQRIVAQLKNQPQDSDLFTATFRQWLGTGQREHVAPQAVAYAQQIDKQLPAPDSAQHERAAQYVAKNGTPLAKQAEAERDIARLLAVAENDQAELFPYPLPTDTGRPAARRKRVSPGTLPDEVAARARQALTEPTNAAALEKAWADGDTISGVITALVANPARSWDIRGAKIATPQDLLTFTAVLRTPYVETLKVLLLNASQEVMHSEIVTVGSINSSLAPMRLIADVISRSPDPSAKYGVIMSHNHPSGDPTPSNADRQVTVELQRATQTLGHEFVDHVVTNGSKYYSFREMGATVASQGINRTRKRPAAGAHLDERADPSQPAPWETVPRTQRQPMQNEAATTAYLATARQIDPNALHVYFVNNKNYLVAVQRVSNYTDPAAVMPKIGLTASQAGATSFFIGFPDHVTAADVVRHLRLIREQTKMLGLELLDAVSSNLQGNARALGLVFESQAMFDMNTALGIDLPNEIRNLQPRWQTKPLEFESSLDKALYYAGGEGNTATRELIVRSLASQTTLSAGQIASLARELRAKLRNLANQTSTNATVRVPALMQKAVADLTGVEFAQAADAQATLQIDDVNLPADASHLMRQLAIFGRKFNALNRAVKSDRDPSLLNIYIKIAQRLQHQLLSEIGGMDESDLVQVVNAVQPDSAAAAIILRAAQSNAGWPSMALVYENGTISGGSAGSLVQERGKKSDYGALVRYEEDTRDHPEGRISRSWNTRSDRLQLSAFEIRGATRNELKLALWNDRVTLRHGQKTMEFPARELVRRALSEGRAEFLRSMTPEVSRLLMERSGQTPESFWRAVREGDVTLTNTLAQKPSRRRDQFKKAGRYVGPLPVTGTPQIAQAPRYQEEQASIDFAQAADPTAARIQEIDARLAALQEGADQDGESAEAEGQALTEERAALVKQQQQAARDALVAATLVANEATPVSQAAKDNQHPAAQGTVPAGEAWAPVASLTDAELIKEQKAAGAHLSKNFSDLSNIERAQITQRLAVLEAEHARRTDEIIANAPRVTPITTPDRRTALLAELHRGRQLRDTGARDGSLEAEQEGIRIVRASTDRLNEEYPGWDAAAGNADAAQDDGRNLPPAPPAEPPEYAAPQGDEPPPNRGRAIELYGHSAHQPAFLQRAWNKIRPSLLGIRGSVPELPAFPAARWNKTDRFIKEHGPGFYNGLKEFWRALRSGNDYIQRTAEEQVAQITQPLLNLGTPFNADQYRRLQQLQEKVRVLKTEGRQPNARMAANLAALQSQLEAHPYVLFSRFVLLMDLNWRSQNLKDSQGQPIKMPAGLNTTEINAELQRLDQRIAAHPHAAAIAQAVEQHRALTKQVAEDLKARDLFAAEHLANPSYFPHLTLEVTQGDKVKQRELRPERVRPGTEADFRGYLIDPVGSLKPIETDYVRAMYYHLVQIGAHNFKTDAIKNHARPYDVRSQVEARAKQLSRERGTPVSWEQAYNEEFAPAGYVLYGTDSRDAFPQLQIDRDKLARRLGVILTSEDIHQQLAALGKKNVRLLPEDLRETLVQGQREVWILPARVAEALRGIADRQEEQEVKRGNPMSASLAMWKAWKLFTPQNHVRYEFNNIVADVEKIFSATPGTFKKLGQSAQEIRAFYQGGRPNDDLRAALKAGVINAITAQEMGQLQRMKAFEKFQTIGQRVQRAIIARGSSALYQPVTNLLGLGQLSSVELSAFRESVTRYANYLANLEAIRHGARPEYAGAYWRDIEAIQDSEPGANDRAQRQAAQISKATFGDYGDLSVNGEWLRKNLVPFYSWMEVNFKYHANLLRNLRDMASLGEISRARAIAQGTAAIGGKAVGLGARTAAGVVTRLALPYAAMAMWNAFGGAAMGLWDKDDDLESQLSAEDRRRFHLILGRNPDGTLSVLYGATALADVMKWFSGPKFMQSMGDWLRGKTDFGTAVNDWAEQIRPDLLNTAAGGLGPVPKVAVALTLRKNVFPDVLDARTIPLYDLRRNILGQITDDFTADMIERTLNQDYVPSKAIGTWAKQLVLQSRRRDPEAWAFYAIKDQAAEFEYKQTGKRTGFADRDSPDQQVLRNFRRAIYQGDAEVAAKMYLRLLDYGYTSERFAASIRSQDPLSGIPKKDGLRQKFVQSLDADGRQQLARAFRYFGRMTSAKGTEKMLFPSDQDGPAGRAAARRQPRTQLLKKIMALQAQEPEAAAQKRAQFQLYQSLMPAR